MTILSLVLFFCGVTLAVSSKISLRPRLFQCLLILFYTLFYAAYLVADNFTGNGINEATLFHVRYGLRGAGFSEHLGELVTPFMFLSLGVLLSALLCYRITAVTRLKKSRQRMFVVLFFFVCSFAAESCINGYLSSFLFQSSRSRTYLFFFRLLCFRTC